MRSLPNIVKGGSKNNVIEPYEFSPSFGRPKQAEDEEEQFCEEVDLDSVFQADEEHVGDALEQAKQSLKNGGQVKGSHYDIEEAVLNKALEKAKEILDTARQEAVGIRQTARERGYAEGLESGKKAGYVEAYEENRKIAELKQQEVEADIKEFFTAAVAEKESLLAAYLEDLKNLSVAVAEKVIQVSLKSSGEVVKRMIIAATDTLKQRQWVKIYIAKCDAAFLAEGDAALLQSLTHLSDNVKIVAMEGEESGTCIIELPDEIIDASVSSQMENIKEIISNARI